MEQEILPTMPLTVRRKEKWSKLENLTTAKNNQEPRDLHHHSLKLHQFHAVVTSQPCSSVILQKIPYQQQDLGCGHIIWMVKEENSGSRNHEICCLKLVG
jgi:hypothetical protein